RDGPDARAARCEILPALPQLRDQLQSRGRHGEALHRETQRRRSRQTLERIREIALIPTPPKRNSKLIRNPGIQENLPGLNAVLILPYRNGTNGSAFLFVS